MDDAAGVGGIQSGSGLHRNASGVAPGQTAVAEPAPQGLASKQLGHHEGNTTLLAHLEKRHDVRVRQGRDGPGFTLEARQCFLMTRKMRLKHLQTS